MTAMRFLIAVLIFIGAASPAPAETFPDRPIKIIAPFTPGSPNDVVARLIAAPMAVQLGQSVVVDNRPGGGTTIGVKAAMMAEPDGYTLLISNSPTHFISPLVNKTFTYDPLKDFVPVATIASGGLMLVIAPDVPAKTLQEFVAYAKANPGKLSMASGGIGSGSHVAGELFKMMAGVHMVHVPYRGVAPALTDLLGGQVQVMAASSAASIEYIRSSKLRALAVTGPTRTDVLPDIPSVGEFLPGYEASGWFGVGAPRNTPGDIIDRLNNEINAGLADPRIKARFADLGGTVLGGSAADFGKFVADETEKWSKVVKFAGAKAS